MREQMTSTQLVDLHNTLAATLGQTALKKWKGKKADLLTRIESLETEAEMTKNLEVEEAEEVNEVEEADETPTVVTSNVDETPTVVTSDIDESDVASSVVEEPSEADTKPRTNRTIRDVSLELLSQVIYYEDKTKKASPENRVAPDHPNARSVGRSYQAILADLHRTFPGGQTSVACLRWYAVKVRNPDSDAAVYSCYTLPQRRERAPIKR